MIIVDQKKGDFEKMIAMEYWKIWIVIIIKHLQMNQFLALNKPYI